MEIDAQIIGPRHGTEPEVIDYLINRGTAVARQMVVRETFGLRYELDGHVYTDIVNAGDTVKIWQGTPAVTESNPQYIIDIFHYTWVIFALPTGGNTTHLYLFPEYNYKQIRNQRDGGDNFFREDEPNCPGTGDPIFLPLEILQLHHNLRYQIDLNDEPIPRPQRHVYLLTGLRKAFPDNSDPPVTSYQGQYGYELRPRLEYPQHIWSKQLYDNDPIGATHFMVAVPQPRIAVSPYNATLILAQDGTVWFTSPGQNGSAYSTQVTLPTNLVTNQTEVIGIMAGWDHSASRWVLILEATDKHLSINGHDFAWLHRRVVQGSSTSTNPIHPSDWNFTTTLAFNNFTPAIASLETGVDWLSGADFYKLIDNTYFPRSFDLITTGVPTQWSMPTFDSEGYMDGWNQASMYIMMPDGTEITTDRQKVLHGLTTSSANSYYYNTLGPNGFDLWSTSIFGSYYLLEVWIDYDGVISTRLATQDSSTFPTAPGYDPSRGTWSYPPLPPLTGLMIGRIVLFGQTNWGQTLIGHDMSHTTLPFLPPQTSFYTQPSRPGVPTPSIPNYFWENTFDFNSLAYGYFDATRPFPLPAVHNAVVIPLWATDYEFTGAFSNAAVRTLITDSVSSIGGIALVSMANGYMPGNNMGAPGGPLLGYPVPFDYGIQVHGWWISNLAGYLTNYANIGGWATSDSDNNYDVDTLTINSDGFNVFKTGLVTWDMPQYTRQFNTRTWFAPTGARFLYQPDPTAQSVPDNYGGFIPVDPSLFPGWETYTNPCRPINDFGFQQIPSVVNIAAWFDNRGGNPRQFMDPVLWFQDSINYWNDSVNNIYPRVKSQSQFSYDLTWYRSPKVTFIPNTLLPDIMCVVTFDGQLVYDITSKKWRSITAEFDVVSTNILAQRLGLPTKPVNIVEVRQQGIGQPVLAADTIMWQVGIPFLHTEFSFTNCVAGISSTSSNMYCTEAVNGDLMSYIPVASPVHTYQVPTGTLVAGTFYNTVGTSTIRTVRIVTAHFPIFSQDRIQDFVTTFSFSVLWPKFIPIGDEVVNLTYESGSPHDSIIAIHGAKGQYSVQKYTNNTSKLLDGLPDLFPFPTNEDYNIFRFTSAGYTDIIVTPTYNPLLNPSLLPSLARSNSGTHATIV